ncbi:MAG TPA: hypothetical protein VLD16_00565 [Gaiellaceae bacterium]|nr:hypothetical protein [Gaiellaceae bacterium]
MVIRGTSFRSASLVLALAAGAALAATLLAGAARPASRPVGLLAFARADGIYVMHLDGSDVHALRQGSAPSGMHWSPNGRKLAFVDGGLWTMSADGTGLVRLVAEGQKMRQLLSPTWAPQGRRIAFTARTAENQRDIWIVNADGTGLHQMWKTPRLWEWDVDWSPAGNQLAFSSATGMVFQLYVMDANGGHRRVLNPNWRRLQALMPEWSPNGRRLAFMGFAQGQHSSLDDAEIWVANANGSLRVRLTRNKVVDSEPAWSADGRRIAFVRGAGSFMPPEQSSPAELYVMNADGTSVTRLTANDLGEGGPAWQPLAGKTPHALSARDPRLLARTLDLVWISDSVGLYTAPHYAFRIRRDLGVRVRVHDEWESGLPASIVLARLRQPSHHWVRLIRNAEVIVVSGNPSGLVGDDCVTRIGPPVDTRPQVWTKYAITLKAIYKRIFAIRKGRPVILRTNNWYVPIISHAPPEWSGFPPISWQQAGVVAECTKRHEEFSAAIARAAGAYEVPVADLYTGFNGTSHLEDPVAKGLIQGDGIHINTRGRKVFVRALAAFGYRPVAPRH